MIDHRCTPPATINQVTERMLRPGVPGAVIGVPEVPLITGSDQPPALGARHDTRCHLRSPAFTQLLVTPAVPSTMRRSGHVTLSDMTKAPAERGP